MVWNDLEAFALGESSQRVWTIWPASARVEGISSLRWPVSGPVVFPLEMSLTGTMLAPGWSPGTVWCHMMAMLQGLPTWLSKYWIKIGNFWLGDMWDLKITTQRRYNKVLKLREISNFQNYHRVSTTPRLYWETTVDVWGREKRSWRWLHLIRAGGSACLLLVLLLPGFSVTQYHLSP